MPQARKRQSKRPDSRQPDPTPDFTEAKFSDFVGRFPFKYAKTMPEHPHEYITRAQVIAADQQITLAINQWDGGADEKQPIDRNESDFEAAVLFIREHGYTRRWGSKIFTYYDLQDPDGQWWQYWTMGAPMHRTIILNRAKVDLPTFAEGA